MDMEKNLDNLIQSVTRLADKYNTAKRQREELIERVGRLESDSAELSRANANLRHANEELRTENDKMHREAADESRLYATRDPQREERIRTKLDDMLLKLDGMD
ncbi:MAG: hypothetical protein P9M15_07260 [Candidatus Electryoneaceae bacterium]|nr:hypothetical protein [Candidatus Electryoneaceae bacterium]